MYRAPPDGGSGKDRSDLMNHRIRILGASIVLWLSAIGAGCTPSEACNGPCPSGSICNADSNTCVPTSGVCQSDADCTSGTNRTCHVGLGTCVGCLTDANCASGQCNTTTFTCLPSECRTNEDCTSMSGTPFCSADGNCVECRASVDCQPKDGVHQICDAGTHQCVVNPCMTDQDCRTDPSGGTYCDVNSGGCVACLSDAHCSGSKSHCLPETRLCAMCASDTDCDAALGQTCTPDTHVCKVTKCVSDASCDGGRRCELSSGSCVACLADSDCYFGGACQSNVCVQPASCTQDTDCIFGSFCASGQCAACRNEGDCAIGQTCAAGVCQEPATCTASNMCLSGRECVSGACADATCTADPGEPNEVPNTATPITAGRAQMLTATLCPNDVDFYVVSFPEDSGGVFTLTTDAGTPPLTLDLYQGPGSPPLHVAGTSSQGGTVSAQIDRAQPGSQALLIRIGGGQAQTVSYKLEADVQIGGLCTPTGPSGNSISEAQIITPGTFSGSLCPNDQAWVAIDVPAGNRVTVSFTSDAPALAVAVEIRTALNGVPAVDQYGTTDVNGNVTVTSNSTAVAGGQRYWVQLYNLQQIVVNYSATVDVIPQAPLNDQCAHSNVLSTQTSTAGHLQGAAHDLNDTCGGAGGDVFWQLQLNAPSQVEINLNASFPATLSLFKSCDSTLR